MNALAKSLLVFVTAFTAACTPAGEIEDLPYVWDLPPGVEPPAVPEDNALTMKRIALGRRLFYDDDLSLDSSINCGTCHQPQRGFSNPRPVMFGIENRLGFRNTPTLTQVAYSPYFFAEGGSPTLEMQVLGPIENHDEFGFNAAELYERIRQNDEYQALAREAYGRPMDLFVLTRAIASFERTLVSSHSPFDNFYYRGDSDAMSPAARRGWELFISDRTQCRSCHDGFAFSTYEFANVGLADYQDEGLTRRTMEAGDVGKFKVPTLRNVALTAPYFHDGSVRSLREVVEHFNRGGEGHPNQDPRVKPLGLNEQEVKDLVEFLRSLTDTTLLNNPNVQPIQ